MTDNTLLVDCDWCKAKAGQPCRNMLDESMTMTTTHTARKARAYRGEGDDETLD